jgi:ATP-dependent protease ClpP protease subunit
MAKKKVKVKAKKKKCKKKKNGRKIDIGQILLQQRQLFIFGVIDDKLATHIISQLIAIGLGLTLSKAINCDII